MPTRKPEIVSQLGLRFVCFLIATLCARLHGQVSFEFATISEAREVLARRDDFVQSMSPFDRAARMKTSSNVSETDFLTFAGTNVLAWTDSDKQKVTSATQGIEQELATLPLPKKVLLIKTTGDEEGKAAYTRANAIIIPAKDLKVPNANMQKIICHELFHIISRANPKLREELYAAIGFVKCNDVEFPSELKSRKITNPDAPRNDHCIRLRVGADEHWAVPILYSGLEKYDEKRGGEFFDYLQFRFLLVERRDTFVKPLYDGANATLVDKHQVQDFDEQVGKNTEYILHPEEILADNFTLLVLRERNLRSPEIIKKLERILSKSQWRNP